MGLPTICIAVSNTQQANGEVMATFGAHVYLGPRETVSIEQLRRCDDMLEKLLQRLTEAAPLAI